MTEPSIDVDRVVREVMARLGLAPTADSPAAAPLEVDGSPVVSEPHRGSQLVISCRVVTLSEVEGRLESVRRLVVPPQAVVTPAVRDELQRRNVSLAFAAPANAPANTPATGQLRLVLVTVGKGYDSAALVQALSKDGIQLQQHSSDCLIAATDQLAGEVVRGDTLGLLLTQHTAAGLCLANRHTGVRAVSGNSEVSTAAAAVAVGANLLVVDPAALGLFQLRKITAEFYRSGPLPCPEVFRTELG